MKWEQESSAREGAKMLLAACLLLAAAVLCARWTASAAGPEPAQAAPVAAEPASQVVVTYFHTTFRCPTCLQIEKHTRDTVEKDFAQDLASKRVLFRTIDVQEAENRHFIQDYSLYSKSVVLSLVKNGKEIRWKNLPDIWKYAYSWDKFEQYIRSEIETFLKELGS